jgi:FkbM family methyltransferase
MGSSLNACSDYSLEDAVTWGYRLLLGREPESAEVVKMHASAHSSVGDIRAMFMKTEEFGNRAKADGIRAPDAQILAHFPPWTGDGEPGFCRDFLGVRTRVAYLPSDYARLSGAIEGPPGTERVRLHEIGEWIGTLRSVLEARSRNSLVVVELGAGWGPWLAAAAKAAERLGITNVSLAGVEGSSDHFRFMQQHFRDNGLDPDSHLLIHGVVGTEDGTAQFPTLADPSADWGAMANYDRQSNTPGYEQVRCVALTTLVNRLPPIDLIHCDIQGAEYEVLAAARPALAARVRRVIVGTHSRRIEADLLDLFADLGWQLEDEQVCQLVQPNGRGPLIAPRDGYQVWSNPSL